MFKKKILFIVNPISGGHNKEEMVKDIPKLLDINRFDVSIIFTKYAGHAAQIAKEAVKNKLDIVVAVGGDGTINEVAAQLVNTDIVLAIIPCGSGNGLARDLGISLRYKEALNQINILTIRNIDVGICNQQYFFSIVGIGFDAKVAFDFNKGKKRKLLGYVWAILNAYFHEKSQTYEIVLDNNRIASQFFFVTIANCSQWGYNVKVAPKTLLDDGLFTINLCKRPPFFSLIPFGIKLVLGKIDTSKYCTLQTAKKISIQSANNFFYHIDGDAKETLRNIEIQMIHKKLRIISK